MPVSSCDTLTVGKFGRDHISHFTLYTSLLALMRTKGSVAVDFGGAYFKVAPNDFLLESVVDIAFSTGLKSAQEGDVLWVCIPLKVYADVEQKTIVCSQVLDQIEKKMASTPKGRVYVDSQGKCP